MVNNKRPADANLVRQNGEALCTFDLQRCLHRVDGYMPRQRIEKSRETQATLGPERLKDGEGTPQSKAEATHA